MNQDTNTSSGENQSGGTSCCGGGFDFNCCADRFMAAVKKSWGIVVKPAAAWSSIKGESATIKSLYLDYILIMAAIPVICGFLGMLIFGIKVPLVDVTVRVPFFGGLVAALAQYILSVAMLLVYAVVIEFLVPKFEGAIDRVGALKLLAYSLAAAFLAGVLSLHPLLGIIGGIASLYGLYIYYVGIPIMTGIAPAKTLVFMIASIVACAVVGMIAYVLVSLVVPLNYDRLVASRVSASPQSQQMGQGLDRLGEFMQ